MEIFTVFSLLSFLAGLLALVFVVWAIISLVRSNKEQASALNQISARLESLERNKQTQPK